MESEGKRYALIIANSQYRDPLLRKLVAPSQDAQGLSEVLAEPMISGFQVKSVIDAPSYQVCEEIETFFEDRDHDHLLLLYFSGHGVTDDDGLLYYATANTQSKRLRSTAISAAWVNEVMSRSLSRRQVLLLDCCHSGAFARTKSGSSVNVGRQLAGRTPEEGRGRFVLTASDAFQYSFEGDTIEGNGTLSVFTKAFVQGLRTGCADLDGDGLITLDEIYRYVHQQVREQTPQQSPRKWESDAEGSLVIAFNPQPPEMELPPDLVHSIESFMYEAREKAIPRLDRLMRGKHRGLAIAARKALEALAEDDSRRVSTAAKLCLGHPMDICTAGEVSLSTNPIQNPLLQADHKAKPRSSGQTSHTPQAAITPIEQSLLEADQKTSGEAIGPHASASVAAAPPKILIVGQIEKPVNPPTLPTRVETNSKWKKYVLVALPVVLISLWILGLVSSYTLGGWIHIFLLLAIVTLLVRFIHWIIRVKSVSNSLHLSKSRRWWKEPYYVTAGVFFGIWGLGLAIGFTFGGWIHVFPLISVVLLLAKSLFISRANRAS